MQKGANSMQICSDPPALIRELPIALPPDFPIHAPYLDRYHYSGQHPADFLHYHHSWELGICQQGSGIFYIGSRVFRYAQGDVSVIAPEVVHIAQSDATGISGWQFLDVDFHQLLRTFPAGYEAICDCSYSGIVSGEGAAVLRPLIQSVLEEMCLPRPYTRELICLRMGEAAVQIRRLSAHHSSLFVVPGTISEISPAVLYIANHYAEQLSIRQLASICMMSDSSFRRRFAQVMRTSPFEYLYHIRIQAAVNLLRTTTLSATQIASQVGYRTLSSFNRHFRRITGSTPREIRKGRPV